MSAVEPAQTAVPSAAPTAAPPAAPLAEAPAAVRPLLGMLGDQTAIVCEGDACYVVPGVPGAQDVSGATEVSVATPGR